MGFTVGARGIQTGCTADLYILECRADTPKWFGSLYPIGRHTQQDFTEEIVDVAGATSAQCVHKVLDLTMIDLANNDYQGFVTDKAVVHPVEDDSDFEQAKYIVVDIAHTIELTNRW